ncbi:MAG: nucleotide-binding protein [Propionivibrio sp.]|nr:nucleotide-binding protein [Propionivibrio sp.]
MTAEDEHADATVHARANVIHEVGLFQGRLGMRKAIVLLEEGCHEFSNIHGLSHIPFSRGQVFSTFRVQSVGKIVDASRVRAGV